MNMYVHNCQYKFILFLVCQYHKNLIFSELSIIVSPSIIFNDELAFKTFEKANVLINKTKKNILNI